MGKQVTRLNEAQLQNVIKESVKKLLKEFDGDNYYGGGLPDSYHKDGYTESPIEGYPDIEDSKYFDKLSESFNSVGHDDDEMCKEHYQHIKRYMLRVSACVDTAIKKYGIPKDEIKLFLKRDHSMYLKLQKLFVHIYHF